ncbi:MAG: carboxynorspermidine decarboxylase [Anaeromassilibacillus sp.]|nr:carboxynorspermidine decarboxylase [Anaeromassilibacillus sp.]MDY3778631.1 carboxynorspermidine decarboxylase [Candidatus Limousia pullorum]
MEKYIVPGLPTPYFVVDESLLIKNLEILKSVCDRAGCKILLAQKAFSMYRTYPLISRYLYGTTASGLHEARLGKEEFPGETHVFSPAYREDEFEELLTYADHFVFNSPRQVEKFGIRAKKAGKQIGLRINPQCSTQEGHEIYDPCADGSRLGTTLANFDPKQVEILDGLHFHTLCEQNSDDLETTVIEFEKKFGKYLHSMKWLNLGGGHHITRKDYDIEKLINIVKGLKKKYNVEFYLEPGEAVVLNAGFLVTSVMEAFNNVIDVAIVDTSAACHMPDVIEMPYRPPLYNSGESGEKKYTYRLGGPTCLAGDVIGDYSFDEPLKEGDKLIFEDMALYTMVKTNTFNGMKLPSIVYRKKDGRFELVRSFGYEDFKSRL